MPPPDIESPSTSAEESKPQTSKTSTVSKAAESVKDADEFEEDAEVLEALAMEPGPN